MTEFTPFTALLGGGLIGIAAVSLMAVQGRIAGISGIFQGIFSPFTDASRWKMAFLAGLITAPLFYWILTRQAIEVSFPHPTWLIALGGLLVGFGTRFGSGCTSGHGVCGMARFSKRSIAATFTFMVTGIVTVFLIRILIGGEA